MNNGGTTALRPLSRYGAAEIFGRAVAALEPAELRAFAGASNRAVPCPFTPQQAVCHKKGGVCSLGLFKRDAEGAVTLEHPPVATCPSRFHEGNKVFEWVSELLLGTRNARVVSEVSFLMAEEEQLDTEDEVGRIDNVLVTTEGDRLKWCALETQAVYFSGGSMESDFAQMRDWAGLGLPFPTRQRRPDFRSSGPKRLMPQLQTKVPTLRRWGTKMAVVVDRAFFESFGEMRRARFLSNADIVWFVLDYGRPVSGRYCLMPHEAVFTTLEHAVEGLTGGTPVSLEQFEDSIRLKLARQAAI